MGKSQEKALRESPPNCLVDPSLGTHLHVKINVSNIHTNANQLTDYSSCLAVCSSRSTGLHHCVCISLEAQKSKISAHRTASFIMWKMVQEKELWYFAFMISQIFGMDGETN